MPAAPQNPITYPAKQQPKQGNLLGQSADESKLYISQDAGSDDGDEASKCIICWTTNRESTLAPCGRRVLCRCIQGIEVAVCSNEASVCSMGSKLMFQLCIYMFVSIYTLYHQQNALQPAVVVFAGASHFLFPSKHPCIFCSHLNMHPSICLTAGLQFCAYPHSDLSFAPMHTH